MIYKYKNQKRIYKIQWKIVLKAFWHINLYDRNSENAAFFIKNSQNWVK